jgi:hypothetical protein
MVEVTKLTRSQLYNMKTTELYELAGKLTSLSERVKAELIARGDY